MVAFPSDKCWKRRVVTDAYIIYVISVKDVEEPWQVNEQLGSISDPCSILIPISVTVEHAGNNSFENSVLH